MLLLSFILSSWCFELLALAFVAFRHEHKCRRLLLQSADVLLRQDRHRYEVLIDDWHLQDTVEAIDPQVTLFCRRTEESEISCVCFQLKAKDPRRLLAINLRQRPDPLDANYLSPIIRQLQTSQLR